MKKANTNIINKLLRKSCAATLALVLLPHPWTSSAFAQQQNGWAQVGMQAIQGVSGALQGAMMQAQMMTPIDLSQSMIRNVPAANLPAPFNKCLIPQANIEMPKYCDGRIELLQSEFMSVPDLSMSSTYRNATQTKQFAEKSIADLERMLDEGKNEFSNGALTGVQCLNDAHKKEKTRRQGILNSIQARIDDIKKRNKQFAEQVKLVKLEMDKVNAELFGSKSGANRSITDQINPPIKNLPANCQLIINPSSNASFARNTGLLNIRDESLQPIAIEGGKFLANQRIYKDDITRYIQNSKNHIAQHGIESFYEQSSDLFKGNPQLKERIASSLKVYLDRTGREVSKIKAELAKVGYEVPALDKNFKSDFETFKADSKSYFRKKFVNECVAGGNNNLTVDPATILASLRQEGTNNEGTTILSYKAALKNILESDSFIDDKIEAMKALDQRYGEGTITITLANANAKSETKPAYVYFQQAIAMCEREFEDDKTFSAQDSGRSASVKMDRAEKYLNDLQKIHDGFAANMTTEITNDVLNCQGRSVEVGSCKKEAFNMSGNFCFQTAESCATQVNSCFAIAEDLVNKKTAELNKQADKYNGMVETLFKDQERYLAEFRSAVMQEAGLLNALVPGADFVFPEDLLVSAPELKLDSAETQTYLRGSPETIEKDLNDLAKRMKSLQKSLSDQGGKADKVLADYIREQKSNIKENKDKFKDVMAKCDRLKTGAEDFVMKYNEESKKAEAKAQADAEGWCRRFYDLSENPTAGCGEPAESLYEDAARAISLRFITNPSYRWASEYSNLCASTQNDRENSDEEGAAPITAAGEIARNCAEGGDWESAVASQKEDFLQMVARQHDLSQEDMDAFNDFISGKGDDSVNDFLAQFDDEIADDRNLASDLRGMRSFLGKKPQEQTRTDFLKGLGLGSIFPSVSGLPTSSTCTHNAETEAAKKAACDAVFGVLQTKLGAYQNASGDQKLTKLKDYLTYAKSVTGDNASALTGFNSILPHTTDISDIEKKAPLIDVAMEKVKELINYKESTGSEGGNAEEKFTPSQCDMIAAETWSRALSSCIRESGSTASCVSEKAEEMFDDGSALGRSVASLGLRSSREAQIEDDFARLGQERKLITCNALNAGGRQNQLGELESFDRQVLGDQYDEVMR